MKQYTVKLTPSEPTLKGKYPPGVLVLVMCNAEKAGFTINMPDCGSITDNRFELTREDQERGNEITVVPFGTQKINNETEQKLRVGMVIILRTDRKNWW